MAEGYLVRSFDLFNVRDLDLITKARNLCNRLTVAVLDDEVVEALTGSPPLAPLDERVKLARHVRGIDKVVVHQRALVPCTTGEVLVFRVAGEPALVEISGQETVSLVSDRETASVQVRGALAPVQSSVA